MAVEVTVVSSAHAIIDPRAVVVKSLHAPITDVAVSTSWQSNDFAKRAKRARFKCCQQIKEVDVI